MSRLNGQVTHLRNKLLRGEPGTGYADSDDASWMYFDWPAVTVQSEIDGRRVNFVDTGGRKPPVVLIHGLGGNWQNWLLNIPVLAQNYRVIAVDLPGFGESEMPVEPISIPGYAHFLDGLMESIEVDQATVIGSSMGGFVAAELALDYPNRVRHLGLVAAAGLSSEFEPRRVFVALARLWVANNTVILPFRDLAVVRPRIRRAALHFTLRYPHKLSSPLTWEVLEGVGKPGFLPALSAIFEYSFRDRLHEIDCPVLITWGDNDLMVPVDDAQLFQHLIGPNAHTVIFEDTGHSPMIERPEQFNSLVTNFLSQYSNA